jgi:predicted nucleic acid-binding protein
MPRAYIESSVPSFYVARLSRQLAIVAKQQATKDWWNGGCSGLDLVTSLETLDEIAKGDSEKAQERLELVATLPILAVTEHVADLAEELVESGIVPKKVASDAIHIAVASVHEVEFLVTWNFKHIANPFLRDRIRHLVTEKGFRMPTMCSPEELLEYNEND